MDIEKRIERARADVRKRAGQHRAIAKSIGVSYPWLRKFASGEVVEPGAVKFARLENWLAEN